jgi:5-formyltetrahydrofolate cyclo-ligase
MKLVRSLLHEKERARSAELVTEAFVASESFERATHIATYLPHQNELDTSGIVQATWQARKCCYLPVVAVENKDMAFVRYEQDTILQANYYGILEPVHPTFIEKLSLDIVLMPLVAFDKAGFRLGMGAGFYDRTFAYLAQSQKYANPLLIGLAYSVQETDDVFHDSWDIPLHAVVTEQGMRWFIRNSR